ncbi:MAG: ATP-dependent Clp protease ATP-binding subunit [Patescibacteria group bacterium]
MKLHKNLKNRLTKRALTLLKNFDESQGIFGLLQNAILQKGSMASNILDIEKSKLLFDGKRKNSNKKIFNNKSNIKKILIKALLKAKNSGHSLIGTHHILYETLNFIEQDSELKNFLKKNKKDFVFFKKNKKFHNKLKIKIEELIKNDFMDLNKLSLLFQKESFIALNNLIKNDIFNEFNKKILISANKIKKTYKRIPSANTVQKNKNKTEQGHRHTYEIARIIDGEKNENMNIFSNFAEDLVRMAKLGKLDPLIGRENELNRLIQILNRRTKRNPILVGDAGVGKTAIVYGLAYKIAKGDVPYSLADKKLWSLNLSSLVAGTRFRGDFEERFEAIIREAKKEEVILFIDEIHNIVGAGSAMGTMDMANIIKPVLSQGDLQIIGATTFDEYKMQIEQDKALERRFQPILVKEATVLDTIKILSGLKEEYEKFHNIKISEDAIQSSVKLSNKYINDRFLPDKAIDVLDEAAAIGNIAKHSQEAYKKIRNFYKELNDIRKEKEEELRKGYYENAFNIKKKEEDILKKIFLIENEFKNIKEDKFIITEIEVRRAISTMTSIPLEEVTPVISQELKDLENKLKNNIIGQDEAIKSLALRIRRSRSGLNFYERPIGSFVFIGPTGVGKTELAKILSKTVYGDNNFIKLDMSEFTEPHTISRLIGAPAGYIGYGKGGQLTEAVKRNPYSVVLFDEIEKAHHQIFNILLQILEDGYLTDSAGKKIDFKNTIVILTSNAGTNALKNKREIGFEKQNKYNYKEMSQELKKSLNNIFSTELLNRLDEIIVFKYLEYNDIKSIIKNHLQKLSEFLLNEKNIKLKILPKLIDKLAKLSYKEGEGARMVRRVIENKITDKITEGMIKGKIKKGQTVSF